MSDEPTSIREIVLDTETTGLSPKEHRVVEIGCVAMVNGALAGGETFHVYLNPERDMPSEAFDVHGLSNEFLADKPRFAEVAQQFLDFVKGARLVAHNAPFDIGFLNAELRRCDLPELDNPVIDTVERARRKYPGQKNSLDALCERLGVNNAHRTKHGALLDAELLAEVYIELTGGRQRGLGFEAIETTSVEVGVVSTDVVVREARVHAASAEELAAHVAFLKKIKDPVWLKA
jgi:DNA polymerase-3 subunit epsilon